MRLVNSVNSIPKAIFNQQVHFLYCGYILNNKLPIQILIYVVVSNKIFLNNLIKRKLNIKYFKFYNLKGNFNS